MEWAVCSLAQSLILPTARREVQEHSGSHQQHLVEELKEAVVSKSKYCSQKGSYGSLAKDPFQKHGE